MVAQGAEGASLVEEGVSDDAAMGASTDASMEEGASEDASSMVEREEVKGVLMGRAGVDVGL